MAMADEQQELRQVNWNEVFAFTHIFKSFRMAMHLSKLVPALAAIALICLGGVVLDVVWGWGDRYVRPQEIYDHFQLSTMDFEARKTEWNSGYAERAAGLLASTINQGQTLEAYVSKLGYSGRLPAEFRRRLDEANRKKPPKSVSPDEFMKDAEEDWKGVLAKSEEAFEDEIDRLSELLEDSRKSVQEEIRPLSSEAEQQARKDLQADYQRGLRALTGRKVDFQRSIRQVRGGNIFTSMLAYESTVWSGRWRLCFGWTSAPVCRNTRTPFGTEASPPRRWRSRPSTSPRRPSRADSSTTRCWRGTDSAGS